jgi:6-phosphogluconate dehydrogenase (decarboxylating)
MVPAAYVDASIAELCPLLERGDVLIDGGNSNYQDDIARARGSPSAASTTSTWAPAAASGARSAATA